MLKVKLSEAVIESELSLISLAILMALGKGESDEAYFEREILTEYGFDLQEYKEILEGLSYDLWVIEGKWFHENKLVSYPTKVKTSVLKEIDAALLEMPSRNVDGNAAQSLDSVRARISDDQPMAILRQMMLNYRKVGLEFAVQLFAECDGQIPLSKEKLCLLLDKARAQSSVERPRLVASLAG